MPADQSTPQCGYLPLHPAADFRCRPISQLPSVRICRSIRRLISAPADRSTPSVRIGRSSRPVDSGVGRSVNSPVYSFDRSSWLKTRSFFGSNSKLVQAAPAVTPPQPAARASLATNSCRAPHSAGAKTPRSVLLWHGADQPSRLVRLTDQFLAPNSIIRGLAQGYCI